MKIILASNSPRRREILTTAGFEVTVVTSSEESPAPEGLSVEEKVAFLAFEKGEGARGEFPDDFVLSADTVVVLGDEILGKPKNSEDARDMLKRLSGKSHRVLTAYTLSRKGREISEVADTEVELYPISEREIEEYILSGEPFDKAGAYGIQGAFSKFVKGIKGDFYNVVGLPVSRVYFAYQKLNG